MSESVDGDLDRVTQKAWRRFRRELADRIFNLAPNEVVVVSVESAFDEPELGCAPYLKFGRDEGPTVVGEVSGNHHLHPAHRLDRVARRRLAEIGWSQPRPKHDLFTYSADVDSSPEDKLAVMAVSTLREVFGVAHPAFVAGDVTIGPPRNLALPAGGCLIEEPLAVMPDDAEHLDHLVDSALLPIFGSVPHRDDDGDIAVKSGTAVVFVRTMQHASTIKIWAELVVQVTDPHRARFEVEILNRDHPFAKLTLVDDRILGQVLLSAAPFVPAHLRETLEMMCVLADQIDDDDLALRVGGRRSLEPDNGREGTTADDSTQVVEPGIHPAMLTLLQLDAESPGSIKAPLAASICNNDPDLLLELIRWNEQQEIEWRSARDEARRSHDDDDEADVCEHERAHAKRTVKLLRKALHHVVELGDHRDHC